MLNEFPTIETHRLELRRMSTRDAGSLFNILLDRDVTKDMGIDPFINVEQAEGLINFMNNLFERKRAFRCGIFRKEDDALIGTCGFNGWETNRGSRGEIAYDLGKPYWRKGYGTEVVKFEFETMGLTVLRHLRILMLFHRLTYYINWVSEKKVYYVDMHPFT